LTGLNQFGVIVPRLWQSVLYGDQDQIPGNIVDWAQVYDEGGLLPDPNDWKSVYVLGVRFSTTPKEIYSTYIGTNIVVVDDDTGMSVTNDDFSVYADQTWLSIVNKPV